MSEYPIQVEKVHAPPLRDDVIARDRLLDWLHAKVSGRVTLVIAEAGYGKTTLLADFARRTDLRVLWYRLDRGDRDWVGFIAYLVAAIRVQLPDFGPRTAALLAETVSTAPPLETVLDTFIRELADLPPDPTILILDDFHLVDDSPDVATVVNELLRRMPTRLRMLISTRARPHLHLARLRSQRDVAELSRGDLRFDSSELGRLLTVSTSEIDSRFVSELERKTEGWPASIQLILAASRDRDPAGVRSLVRGIGSSESPIYDYLAEEVAVGLPHELQMFLMRTSLLETITPVGASVVTDSDPLEAERLLELARERGLLSPVSAGVGRELEAHPLVRAFFRSRLAAQVGPEDFTRLHGALAQEMEHRDWRQAAHHYLEANDRGAAERVVTEHLSEIIGRGALYAAAEILAKAAAPAGSLAALIVGARVALQQGKVDQAVVLANQAHELRPSSPEAATTLMSARSFSGDVPGALRAAQFLDATPGAMGEKLGKGYSLAMETSVSGPIAPALDALEALTEDPEHMANARFLGVTLSNKALMLKAIANAPAALEAADLAVETLQRTGSALEEVSARLVRAWALAHIGDLDASRAEGDATSALASRGQLLEVASELAEIEFYYGEVERATAILEVADDSLAEGRDQAALIRSQLLGVQADSQGAKELIAGVEPRLPRTSPAFEARRLLAEAYVAWAAGDPSAPSRADGAAALARLQGALLWERCARLLSAAANPASELSSVVKSVGRQDRTALSMSCDILVSRLDQLDSDALGLVESEIGRRPRRWLYWIRKASREATSGKTARRLLATFGAYSDVALLNEIGRLNRDPESSTHARTLARRLAPRVQVHDLGRVRVGIGDRVVDGSSIRRKVLALLCLLVTKPHMSASREDVTEALWPDLDPADALNSLNQTAYFLRRLFEPTFREPLSPGYLHQDGETIWLDPELVFTQSGSVRALISVQPPIASFAAASHLLDLYPAPFTLDFAYEEWAAKYRDPLHAAVLRFLEQAIRIAAQEGRRPDAISLAERALLVEPDAENVQGALIGLYRSIGAHAAAAEQYASYAATLRNIGVEAPPIDEVGNTLGG
jgi:ATP/maltotriose-dependent transcriptional regulator MalT/DNA-binding SARP family transcriptional activator